MKRLSLLFVFLLSCSTASAPPQPVRVVIVGTTDVHGWFDGRVEEGVQKGGLALLASYVDALRRAHAGRVVVVDSGDMFQGTLESNLFEGEPVIRGFNEIGYAAAAVGNHEFDYGPAGPDAVSRQAGDDPRGALKQLAAIAKFPLLSANMTETSTGRIPTWAQPSTIVDAGGVKLGIIGLSTPDTPNVTMRANVVGLQFTDPVAATVREAANLRAREADAVIVIAHMGGRCTDTRDPHDSSSCESQHEANRFLAALPAGTIDAYLGGHTHAAMRHYINGVATAQATALAREFSTVDLWVDPAAGRVVKSDIRPRTMICGEVYAGTESCDRRDAPPGAQLVARTFEGRSIRREPRLTALFEPFLNRVAQIKQAKIGVRSAARFTRNYRSESALGNLIADALRRGTNSDIGFINSGGIRSDLREGELVYGDIFEVSPFDNYPAVVQMTGAEIIETLRLTTGGERGVLQTSGLRYAFDAAAAGSNRVMSVTLPDGKPIDPDATYKVAMVDFLVSGGDGLLPVMQKIPAERVTILYQRPLRDLLVEVFRAFPQPLEPRLEGRITVLNPPRAPER